MSDPIPLGPFTVQIQAPRYLVFELLRSLGDGQEGSAGGERARVIHEDESRKVVEFHSRVGMWLVRTVEEVVFDPPDRVTFQHVEGPLPHVQEEMVLEDRLNGTVLTYQGEFALNVPLLAQMVGRLVIRPFYHRVVRRHLQQLKETAEEMAREQGLG